MTCECGNPLASNERYERMSGMCADCAKSDPDAAYLAFLAAEEAYTETPEYYQ